MIRDARLCDGVTSRVRSCSRRARYVYMDSEGYSIKAYCSQHFRSGGPMRMLRPRPWEYVRVWDTVAKINVREV